MESMYQTFVNIVYGATFVSLIGYVVYWWIKIKQTEGEP